MGLSFLIFSSLFYFPCVTFFPTADNFGLDHLPLPLRTPVIPPLACALMIAICPFRI